MLESKQWTAPRFLKAVFQGLATWITIATGLTYLWPRMGVEQPELTWALTITTGLLVFYLGVIVCFTRQQVLRDRIDECAAAKARLEAVVLKNRLSSQSKKKR